MRKLLAIILSLVLCAAPVAALGAERAVKTTNDYLASINPNGFDMLLVTDIFTNDDAEYDDDEDDKDDQQDDEPLDDTSVQGCFGTVDMSLGEAEHQNMGFDQTDIRTFGLDDHCELLMPADIMNPVENVRITDLQAWYDDAKAALQYDEGSTDAYSFYAFYQMDEDGELTRLEYVYFPWN